MIISHVAEFFLSFSHSFIIAPLLIIGLIWLDRTIFLQVICLVLLSMILNIALKETFQIPLAAWLHKPGFAFPSGHMQTTAVLYGWLAYQYRNVFIRIATLILLTGIGMSLVYFGYHNYFDVLGAIFFASILLFFYAQILKRYPAELPFLIIITGTLLMLYISHVGTMPLMVYFTLIIFSVFSPRLR